jgi:spore germination cell wall hydrolase CwlJ-like protein
MYQKRTRAMTLIVLFLILALPSTCFSKSFFKSIPKIKHAILYDESESICLAKAIYFEARGEPEITKKAIAKVILNRKLHPKFPKTICSVVFQSRTDNRGKVCQFSWVCTKLTFDKNDIAWYNAKLLSNEILNTNLKLPNFNSDVLFFKSTKCKNSFGIGENKLIAQLGATNFYEKKII